MKAPGTPLIFGAAHGPAVDGCFSGLREASALTSVAWTGWWNGNNYDAATGVATGIASAGPSGGRNMTAPSGHRPLHGDSVVGGGGIRQCAMDRYIGPDLSTYDSAYLQAGLRARDFISRTEFTLYAVCSIQSVAGNEVFIPYNWLGHSAGAIGLFSGSMKFVTGGEVTNDVGATFYAQSAAALVPDDGSLFLCESRYSKDSVSGHFWVKVNDDAEVVSNPTTSSTGYGSGTELANGLITWDYLYPGYPGSGGADGGQNTFIGRPLDVSWGHVPSGAEVKDTRSQNRIYEVMVTNTMLDSTTRAAVRAALIAKYQIAV